MLKEKDSENNKLGLVDTKVYKFAFPPDKMKLITGQEIGPVTLVYETYGELNSSKNNAILIQHAFSGDAHAAGLHKKTNKVGWWDSMIGAGKAFDTEKYFVICSNILGGCSGSTGPASINPDTGSSYALDFPFITIEDMVKAQNCLIDNLGIDKLLSVVGGSMGGMVALQWVASFPEKIKSIIPIATALKHSPQQIAFNEVGRQAIMADAHWNEGKYYGKNAPEKGLAVARMIGHITYMSDESMKEKFSRKLKEGKYSFSFDADFEVEGYLKNRGNNFVTRFDANSYLYITKAMDYFDLSGGKLFEKKLDPNSKFLIISFKSDWLYPAYQSKEIVNALKKQGVNTTYCEIKSTYGHDAFLLEVKEETRLIRHFLDRIYKS